MILVGARVSLLSCVGCKNFLFCFHDLDVWCIKKQYCNIRIGTQWLVWPISSRPPSLSNDCYSRAQFRLDRTGSLINYLKKNKKKKTLQYGEIKPTTVSRLPEGDSSVPASTLMRLPVTDGPAPYSRNRLCSD